VKLCKRLFIEYVGSLPSQVWYYNAKATAFWTLGDGRQVSDAGTEEAYRYLLQENDNIVPFVPRDEGDWVEITELAQAERDKLEIALQADRVDHLTRKQNDLVNVAGAMMDKANELELEAQRLRASAQQKEEDFRSMEAEIKAERGKLEQMRNPAPPPPPKQPKKPAAKKPAAKKKE